MLSYPGWTAGAVSAIRTAVQVGGSRQMRGGSARGRPPEHLMMASCSIIRCGVTTNVITVNGLNWLHHF